MKSGILVIDKPSGCTSFDVVRQVRRLAQIKKVGHGGTLDPLATGVLPICLGEATKIAPLLLAAEKTYEGTAILGLRTDTLDITGTVLEERDAASVRECELTETLQRFVGELQQVPPEYSAIKQDGERAYARARRGETINLPPRSVTVFDFRLLSWAPPYWRFRARCSKGTYIRALVRDVGDALGVGATLTELRRTQSGVFTIEQSVQLTQLENVQRSALPLIPIAQALAHLPAVQMTSDEANRFRSGQPVREPRAPEIEPSDLSVICLVNGEAVGVGERTQGSIWPRRVFLPG